MSTINAAIAESLGYTDIQETAPERGSLRPRLIGTIPHGSGREFIPRYDSSLDACSLFESALTYEEAESYDDELCDIVVKENETRENPWPWRFAVTIATATQRCRAYCAVKQITVDEPKV